MTEVLLVLTPGPLTTVQDLGRYGYQHLGMPASGALDTFAMRAANLIVGNPEKSAVLEMTVVGPHLAVMKRADIALTGADMIVKLNSKPVAPWKSIQVGPGDLLSIQTVTSGCRGYLAVTGGIQVPEVMGSRSTYIDGGVGGLKGRPLLKGDILESGPGTLLKSPRRIPSAWIPHHDDRVTLHVLPGPQDAFFHQGLATLFTSEYIVSPTSDRMGCRLQGPTVKPNSDAPASIISEPIMPGSIQVPADGQPIILFAEQTVGGYAKIATVLSTDIPKIAQAVPGTRVRFRKVDLDEAHAAYREQEGKLAQIADMLSQQ
ncbi:MAG: biotin-dependent carboxyltransferase family protein [Thermodesulfobacteriota bacterium]